MYSKTEISEIKNYSVKHICPHYGVNADLDTHPKVYVKSDDCYVYDIEGKKYLDTFGSLLTTICGHNNKKIIEAIYKQINVLDFFPNFGDHYCLPMVELSKKLQKVLPEELSAFFYVNSGSEANETALKIAQQYHVERGDTKRYKVISRHGSYHGTTLGAVSATGLPWFTEKFSSLHIPGFIQAPAARCAHCELGLKYGSCGMKCLSDLEEIIIKNDPETISAIIMDPLPGSNTGYPVPPEGYLKEVRALCDKYGILLTHRIGRFDVSYPVMSFLLSCQAPCGGFPHFAGDKLVRAMSTAWTGITALYFGNVDVAVKAAQCCINMLEQQQDNNRYYFQMTLDGKLATENEYPEAGYIDTSKLKQCYWEVGFSMLLMDRLYQVTKDSVYLEYARRYFEFLLRCREDNFAYWGSGKGALAAAIYYTYTDDKRALDAACRFCDFVVETQKTNGGFQYEDEPDELLIYVDHAACFSVWVLESISYIQGKAGSV